MATTKKSTAKSAPAKKTAAKKTEAEKAPAKKAPAKKAGTTKKAASTAAKPKYLTDEKWLAARRTSLDGEIESRRNIIAAATADITQLMLDRDAGDTQFDDESGEGDPMVVELDQLRSQILSSRAAIEEVEEAIERLADGSYGICKVSGDFISKERLEAIPEASVCPQYKTQMF